MSYTSTPYYFLIHSFNLFERCSLQNQTTCVVIYHEIDDVVNEINSMYMFIDKLIVVINFILQIACIYITIYVYSRHEIKCSEDMNDLRA